MDMNSDFAVRDFKSRHGTLHYLHHGGQGPTIIFIHGFAGSTKTWTRLMQHTKPDFDVYLVDLLGHGESEAPDIDYTVKVQYEALSDLIDSVVSGRYSLFGHSYGGWIAAYYAAEKGGVAGLILEDSSGLKEFHEERVQSNPEAVEKLIRNALEINPREGVLRSIIKSEGLGDPYLNRSRLEMIDAKTMILWGSEDVTVNVKYAKQFNDWIKGSRLEILDGERHTPHYTNPETVARLLDGFARSL